MVVDEYSKFKLRHPLDVIKEELDEMKSNPSDDFKCIALTGNLYDWQLAIRGPNGTEFEGGIYHGRNQFSEEYPSKRPVFTLLTENGCFKTQTDISFLLFCREQSTVQDALHRLIELLPTYPDGALGSVRYDKEERRALAIKSREAPPRYGTAQRQKLIDEIHECMLSKAPPVPSNRGEDIRLSSQNDRDKRMRGKSIVIGNKIKPINSNRVGIFDFGNSFKKAKQDSDQVGIFDFGNSFKEAKQDDSNRVGIFDFNSFKEAKQDNSNRVGFFDFGNSFKKAKQDSDQVGIFEQNQMYMTATSAAMVIEKKLKEIQLSKDIEKELKEMQSNPSDDFKCIALEGNIYDWQIAIRGPNGTEFEGGIYHGWIQFPEEYPRKRPIFKLLTENGRFQTQTEIWFPWHTLNVRDTLHRLIELLPTYPDGALGSVRYDKEERRALAIKSREAPPIYGTAQRQKLINEIHECMLSKAPPVPSNRGGDIRLSSQNDQDKRKRGKSIVIGNTINANNSERVGIFDSENKSFKEAKQDDSNRVGIFNFGKSFKKAKQDDSNRVGIFDFDKSFKNAKQDDKQDDSSRKISSTSIEDNQE